MKKFKMLLVFFVLCLTMTMTAADGPSDVAALSSLVQQQASTIQTMQARLTAFERGQTSLQNEVTTLKASLNTLQSNLTNSGGIDRRVAFSAHMSTAHVYVDDMPFIFNIVITNVGSGYNPTDGVFTAPYAGVYVFHSVVVNDENSRFIQTAIMRGTQVLAVGTVDGGPDNSYDDGSSLVTVELKQGETVFVKRNTGASRIYGDVFCSFSGFLISTY